MTASLVPLLLVQWLHVIAGLLWVGGLVVSGYLLPRAMVGKPTPAARAVYDPFSKALRPLMVVTGLTLMLAGILRGTLFGPVRSLSAAFDTPYGLTWLLALGLTLTLMVHSGRWRQRLPELIWNGELKRPEARARIDRHGFMELAIFAGILACMVLMRFDL
ncbi:MAG TPA: hypothetical protein VGT99_12595 [Gammaproteobacteria bacterium]|nr:hypothetical protein [Gammaproteobacteria bacterium]